MSSCSIIHLLRTLFLMPKSHIPYPLPRHYSYGWVPSRFSRKLPPPDRHVLFSPHRLRCQKANTYNVEQFEKAMNGAVTEQQSVDGKDSVSQDSENGTSRLWNDYICTHIVIWKKSAHSMKDFFSGIKVTSDFMWFSICSAVSFKSCVFSWFFLWHLLWLSIMQLRHYFFIGTLNPTLNRLARNDPNHGNLSLTSVWDLWSINEYTI